VTLFRWDNPPLLGKRRGSDCRQKAILPPKGGRIALSANERIAEFLDFAIQVKFAYVNKLRLSVEKGGALT
jgi:hypothetical protein